MSYRSGRPRFKGRGSELRVKEIILPQQVDQKSAGPSDSDKQCYKYYDHGSCGNTPNTLKLGDHEINTFCGLTILEKPPLENYFQGIKKKKYKKKKPKLRNPNYFSDDSTFCDSFMSANETFQSRHESGTNAPFGSESLEKKYLTRKIFNYEKRVQEEQERNYRRQRLLEKESMEWQENVAETWLGFFQRRQELKKKDLEENPQAMALPRCKYYSYNRPVNISLLPKKYWNDGTDEKRLKPEQSKEKQGEKPPTLPTVFEELESELTKKLVFIDDSDDDSRQPPPF